MASAVMVSAIVGVLLVLLQAKNVIGDAPAPLPPAISDHVCKGVHCGKGTCKPSASSRFFFECQCKDGWKQSRSDDHDETHAYLPCLIPKCGLNYTCDDSAPPAPPADTSRLNPCHWVDCGRGTCKTTSKLFGHTCECPDGYFNLFDSPSYPCVKQCAIGADCAVIGVQMKAGSSMPRGSISWIIISMFFFGTFMCK